jgi:hypothetical protein
MTKADWQKLLNETRDYSIAHKKSIVNIAIWLLVLAGAILFIVLFVPSIREHPVLAIISGTATLLIARGIKKWMKTQTSAEVTAALGHWTMINHWKRLMLLLIGGAFVLTDMALIKAWTWVAAWLNELFTIRIPAWIESEKLTIKIAAAILVIWLIVWSYRKWKERGASIMDEDSHINARRACYIIASEVYAVFYKLSFMYSLVTPDSTDSVFEGSHINHTREKGYLYTYTIMKTGIIDLGKLRRSFISLMMLKLDSNAGTGLPQTTIIENGTMPHVLKLVHAEQNDEYVSFVIQLRDPNVLRVTGDTVGTFYRGSGGNDKDYGNDG